MKRVIVVCGHGPGISDAVARKFGREGFAVAIVARNAKRLAGAAAALVDAGITARAFPCDLGDTDAVRILVREVRASLGPIAVVHWNASAHGARDLTTAPVDELRASVGVSTFGLVAAVQEALPDLKTGRGAVLVTGGGLSLYNAQMDTLAVQWGAMGLAIAKAAQHKAAALLHGRLAGEGVYVGEVVVLGIVKGTAFDTGHATLDPAAIADKFWDLYERRAEASVNFG
jgi:NAD(P)-dependent dehydrogenase (short-subunit alcohol dehydrogenase family)